MEQQNLYLSPEQRKQFSRCFPRLLHFILCEVDKMGLSHIMSWNPSGTHFKIYNEDAFIAKISPRFFVKQSNIRSFYRQLNLWGFERDIKSCDNVWSREHFSREFPEGIKLIKRCGASPQPQPSAKKKPTAKQLKQHQEQKKASPSSNATSKAVAAEEEVAVTSIGITSDAVTDNEVDEAKKIIRAFSARLKEHSTDANRELLTSLLRQAESRDISSNKDDSYDGNEKSDSKTRSVSSKTSTASSTLAKNITEDEQEKEQSIQEDCEEDYDVWDPPSTTTIDQALDNFDTYMDYLEEDDDLDLYSVDELPTNFDWEPTNCF